MSPPKWPDGRSNIGGPKAGEDKLSDKAKKAPRKPLTPRQAIREHCVDCVGSASVVKDCQGDELFDGPCILFPYRMGKGRPSVKLIRKFCLYCMGGSWKLVKEYSNTRCPFLCYRMGTNPSMANRRVRLISLKRPPHGAVFAQESTNNEAPISLMRLTP
jgi:hypothetical protein